jgi:tetratricopeptide (TPR) repeat protein
MYALLSPHSSTALLFQQQLPCLIESGQAPRPLSPTEATAWLSAHEELRWHSADSIAEVEQALSLYSRRREALDLALICLDEDLSLELRDEAQQELETLLTDPAVADWLADLFHARPLPASAAINAALGQACTAQRKQLLNWLEPVIRHQSAIADSWAAWSAIPDKLFQAAGGRQTVLDLALEKGLFAGTVGLLVEGKSDDAKFEALLCLQGVPGYRQIVEAWLGSFAAARNPAHAEAVAWESEEQEEGPSIVKQRRFYDRAKVLRNVEEQKNRIIGLMRSRQWERLPLLIDGLLDYQRRHGGGVYAAKSLCDLATEAKALGRYSVQLDLTERAVEQNPEDGWAWTQYGDALLNNGQMGKALRAYENSVAFGAFAVGRVGRAEVLKAMGRYPEALAAYDAAMADHPEDVVAKSGRAEALKAMGRYPEALAAYDVAIADHPENAVAKSGRAEVLKAMGRYPEALAAYDVAMADHPEDVVAKNGRAEVLKALGRYPEALAAYDAAMADHPENAVAKSGRAEVLKAMGRYPEALAAYDAAMADHPENAVAKSGRAEVLKALGRYPEALAAYDAAMADHPEDVVAKNGRAEVLKALGRYPEALAAYDAAIADHPEDAVAKNGRAEVLKALGRYPEALAAYDAAIANHPESVVAKNGRAEVLKVLGRYPEALAAYDAAIADHPENAVAKSGRAEVLKVLGRYPEALAAYDAAIVDHPENAVAKSGRAEVLKVMGKLSEAATAYVAIREQHPEDLVTRNGYASVLLVLGDYSHALDLLPVTKPECVEDWIGWHIRGMALMRCGKLEEALQVLEIGSEEGVPMTRDYFRTALAMARLWQEDWERAREQIAQVTTPSIQRVGNVVWLHIYAVHDNREGMEQAINALTRDNPPALVIELTEELRLRYLEKKQGRHSDQWLREREIDCLALAA